MSTQQRRGAAGLGWAYRRILVRTAQYVRGSAQHSAYAYRRPVAQLPRPPA